MLRNPHKSHSHESGFIPPLLGPNSSESLWLISIQWELTPHQFVCVIAVVARGAFVLETNLKHV